MTKLVTSSDAWCMLCTRSFSEDFPATREHVPPLFAEGYVSLPDPVKLGFTCNPCNNSIGSGLASKAKSFLRNEWNLSLKGMPNPVKHVRSLPEKGHHHFEADTGKTELVREFSDRLNEQLKVHLSRVTSNEDFTRFLMLNGYYYLMDVMRMQGFLYATSGQGRTLRKYLMGESDALAANTVHFHVTPSDGEIEHSFIYATAKAFIVKMREWGTVLPNGSMDDYFEAVSQVKQVTESQSGGTISLPEGTLHIPLENRVRG